MVASFTCAFGILYYAQFVLPHHAGENWLEGIAMMLRSASHMGPPPASPQQSLKAEHMVPSGVESLSPSFKSLNAGMVRSHQVIAVGKGNSFSYPAGPGFIRLQPGERPVQVIDLRRHIRSADATANTRDGIPLEARVSVTFQVKQSQQDHEGDSLAFPYDKSAIFWVSQLNTFDKDNVVRTWSEQIAPQAATYMISEIAQFNLDELWQDPSIFRGIQQRIRRQLRSNFDEWGIKIHNVKVIPEEMPEEIAEQRLENWRAPWESQIQVQEALGNAEAMRRMRLARARAQVDIIEKIMQNINEMQQTEEASLPEIITLRIIDVLEDAASKNTSQTFLLPSQVMASIVAETAEQQDEDLDDSYLERDGSDI